MEFEREREAFRGLLNEFHDVPDLLRGERMAVAFVVEDVKREASEAWDTKVGELRNELRAAMEREGIPGLTWRFAQEIYRRYDAFLAQRLKEEQNPVRQENLRWLQASQHERFATRREAYETKRRVPMGSVILEHVPQWFAQV
jgi:hypothetical protein